MNDKKPLMDYRRAQKLQTPLLLTGALLSGVGTSVSVPLVILGIAIMLFAIVIGVLYYRCPHCGRPLGRIGEGGAYCPHCGKALNAPVEEPVRSITVPAYAKLNLTLDILGKRDDGYHEMQMVMQTVSLHDDVTVTLTDGKGITCRVDGAALPCDERNLAVKAARAFCEAMDYGGSIDIELNEEVAPITCENFKKLVKEGFYNGLTFHRVIPGFMIQGGCPLGTGTGGPGYNFDDEIVPGLTFDRPYLLAMANAGLRRGMDGKIHGTNGSQFFITTVPTEWLNGHHTIFGEVADDESKAVVDKLDSVATDRSDAPLEPVGITSVEVLK